ncbi:MAG TPA: dihydrolipoamide acetyltransferase family protein [Candidatus Acidoferrales bacterium]|nr:dihydrolipoamide acetyltransferase family protein [Candidatus Acidoferrales bacterium]
MATVKMPQLGETVTEGTVGRWLKKVGEAVAKYEPLLEVETDKVASEIPSPFAGTLAKILVEEGTTVPVGAAVCEISESASAGTASAQPTAQSTASGSAPQSAVSAVSSPVSNVEQPAAQRSQVAVRDGIRYSPAVRKLARELGVDLFHVRGSGEGGRIQRDDVQRVASQTAPSAQTPRRAATAVASAEDERIPLRGLRRVIADHMVHSKHTAAHTLHVDEADLTDLVAMRARAKEKAVAAGVKLTYLPFFVKAVTGALKHHPYMNASLDDEKHEIILKKRYNVGIAVNTDEGLVVPVIHDADAKTIFELAGDIADLADKARHGKLSHEEISSGTFTITNVGSVGGLFTFPVINYPEVGILGTHSIVERPVVRDGQIVIRHMMYLSISFDHRVVDGATAALFVKDVAQSLEHPDVMLMEGG